MSDFLATPIIYNLFPRLVGPANRWLAHAQRAAEMGFNWLYVNPVHYPGFSGSLYAVKDYSRLHPDFVPEGSQSDGVEQLAPALRDITQAGLHPIVDLVINHTAKDSPLVHEHPEWYARDAAGEVASPYAVDPDDATKVTVWGDLAEIDNEGSPGRDALWGFWADLVERYLELGFEGFRCDAAYKVPSALWKHLVQVARRRNPKVVFFGETLGCTLEQARALKDSGLDYFFNSSKWWDFRASWALEQHKEFEEIPSISFPESHDTDRLAAESGGSEAVQRQRYAFAATYSAGLMMPIGYEFGFRGKPDVVRTSPSDWEEHLFDLQAFVGRINRLKRELPLLRGEGILTRIEAANPEVLVLERRSPPAPTQLGWVVVNTHTEERRSVRLTWVVDRARTRMLSLSRDNSRWQSVTEGVLLGPAEVVLMVQDTD
jgi:starch synthase (maltosyl-transferring)